MIAERWLSFDGELGASGVRDRASAERRFDAPESVSDGFALLARERTGERRLGGRGDAVTEAAQFGHALRQGLGDRVAGSSASAASSATNSWRAASRSWP